VTNFRAVLFDWRGTLALTLSGSQWIQQGFRRTGRNASAEAAQRVLDKVTSAPSWSQLMAPDIDTDAARHRATYFQVFGDAEIDQDLARELYVVEFDSDYNPFAQDVGPALQTIKSAGVHIAVLSDIHFDIRAAFERAGWLSLIDLFVLSSEHGVQSRGLRCFRSRLRVSDCQQVKCSWLVIGPLTTGRGRARHGHTVVARVALDNRLPAASGHRPPWVVALSAL